MTSIQRIGPIGRDASRRDMLTKPLGLAGTLAAMDIVSGVRTPAQARELVPPHSPSDESISPSLFNALRFARENSENPGIVFSPNDGLLIGFGPNFYHSDATTTALFTNGKQVFRSSITENVQETVPTLVPGIGGSLTVTAEDSFGRKIKADIAVTSINDPPPDFLVTGEIKSSAYTGAYFSINTTVQTKNASFTVKTVYNVLTGTFPFDFGVDTGTLSLQNADSIFDLNALALLGLAMQVMHAEVGGIDLFVPTDLLRDFSLRKIFRHIVRVVARVLPYVVVPGLITVVVARAGLRALGVTPEQALIFIALAILAGIFGGPPGNYLYDRMKDAGMLPGGVQCPPGTTPNPTQPPPPTEPACVVVPG
jgi:hypothetical protein